LGVQTDVPPSECVFFEIDVFIQKNTLTLRILDKKQDPGRVGPKNTKKHQKHQKISLGPHLALCVQISFANI
jgi:hypothetical protein